MFVSIADRAHLLSREARQAAENRLLSALERFDSRIGRVSLVVSDENGPRGGVDKACRITVRFDRSDEVIISDRDSSLIGCLSRAAHRAAWAVGKAIERKQRLTRTRLVEAKAATLA